MRKQKFEDTIKFLKKCTVVSYESTQLQLINGNARVILNFNDDATNVDICVVDDIEDNNVIFDKAFYINT